MARKRDYAAEYAARQARAREAGFGSYYQRRVSGTRAGSSARSAARGHRGRQDLLSSIRDGDVVAVVGSERDSQGRYTEVRISVLSARTGKEREYRLRGKALRDARIHDLAAAIDAAGAIQSPAYPLSRLYRDLGDEELDADLDAVDVEDESEAS
jgi:hypothetical protein